MEKKKKKEKGGGFGGGREENTAASSQAWGRHAGRALPPGRLEALTFDVAAWAWRAGVCWEEDQLLPASGGDKMPKKVGMEPATVCL